jgi:hypothetical protein
MPLKQDQINARRERYMRGVGLEPDEGGSYPDGFPNADGTNRVPYNGQFDAAHETAHALMTPDDKNLGEYQKWLSDRAAEPEDPGSDDEDNDDYADQRDDYDEGSHHENIANATETYIDRRAGVDPHMFQSKYRSVPKGEDDLIMDVKSGTVRSNPVPAGAVATRHGSDPKTPFHGDHIRDEAKEHVKGFDAGKRFDVNGNVTHPAGVHAAINARAAITPDRPWATPAKAGFAERQGAAQHNADVAARKAELKTHGGAAGAQPKAQAAAAIPPAAPQPAAPTQPKQTGIKLPGMTPKKPQLKVTKAEAGSRCPACSGVQFKAERFVGCLCFAGLAKSVKTSPHLEGFVLELGAGWDADAIATLAETLGK